MWRRTAAIIKKEFLQTLREPRMRVVLLIPPIIQLIIFGYAVNLDVENSPIAWMDQDRTPESRELLAEFEGASQFQVTHLPEGEEEIQALLDRATVQAVVRVFPGFGRDIRRGQRTQVQILVDGTEPQSGGFAVEKIAQRANEFISKLLVRQLATQGITIDRLLPIDVRIQTWYNPNLKASVDIIPGLLSIVLALPGMSVALTLAREREHGTLEQLMASPIGKAELLMGKMLPYILSGLINIPLTTAIALYWFDVPFNAEVM